ncbi:hypothetical protein BACDOR_00156 [Phocaeicola dorei DSM 17855]|uniref:Uncharacterized protein n=1 Tax=Phocaeicola dorei DSM 17855 TaxID=483217 RepID=B6VSC6_9BACT|nr:hypothetical protein BACDOR_00156 [Phocaeicola dorei DSM 17855]
MQKYTKEIEDERESSMLLNISIANSILLFYYIIAEIWCWKY